MKLTPEQHERIAPLLPRLRTHRSRGDSGMSCRGVAPNRPWPGGVGATRATLHSDDWIMGE